MIQIELCFCSYGGGKSRWQYWDFQTGKIHGQTAELEYYTAEDYQGKGIMTKTVKQSCKRVFDNSNIIRIYDEPFAYDTASCRVLEKAGFQCEEVLRSSAIKNGKAIDMKMYSLLKKEIERESYGETYGIK